MFGPLPPWRGHSEARCPTSLHFQHRPKNAPFPCPWRRPQKEARQGPLGGRVCRPCPCPCP
eukprot:11074993-Alexandrium_andersonii.AAC.1